MGMGRKSHGIKIEEMRIQGGEKVKAKISLPSSRGPEFFHLQVGKLQPYEIESLNQWQNQ